jgi:hypothetical protein
MIHNINKMQNISKYISQPFNLNNNNNNKIQELGEINNNKQQHRIQNLNQRSYKGSNKHFFKDKIE